MPTFPQKRAGTDFAMNYEVHPETLANPALFIHGNLASNRWWKPVLDVLRKQNPSERGSSSELILGEWRGCGRSGRLFSADELDPFTLAQDYIALVRELGLRNVDLVGHSTGGVIAICAILQAPELFRSAVLLNSVGPTGRVTTPENRKLLEKMQRDRAVCARVMAATIYAPATLAEKGVLDPELFEAILGDTMAVDPLIWLGVPDMLERVQLSSRCSEVRQPVLILHGQEDPLLPLAGAQQWEEGLQNARLTVLPGLGHSCNIEAPELVLEQMTRFWNGLNPG